MSVEKHALDLMGDGLPAEEPQNSTDRASDPAPVSADKEYKFVYGKGQLEIGPSSMFDHKTLAGHAGIGSDDPAGPIAVGYANVSLNQATWSVKTNMSMQALARILKDYTKHVDWKWGGITSLDGEPIGAGSEFAPKKSMTFSWDGEELRLSTKRLASAQGRLIFTGKVAEVVGMRDEYADALEEFAADHGFTLTAEYDNLLKTQEDMEMFNNGNPDSQGGDDIQYPAKQVDERDPSGCWRCQHCDRLFPSWHTYKMHRLTEEGMGDEEPRQDGGFPQQEESAIEDSHFTERQPAIDVVASAGGLRYQAMLNGKTLAWVEVGESNRWSSSKYVWPLFAKIRKHTGSEPKDLLDGPVPFIYDVQDDAVFVGQPNQKTSEIPGKFTPGGIIEGIYEPGGKVIIRSMTNMPYTVRHMVELWYWQHPELEVKSVHLRDDAGRDTKLANNGEACPSCGATDEYQGDLCYSCGHGSMLCPRCDFEMGGEPSCPSCGYEGGRYVVPELSEMDARPPGYDGPQPETPAWTVQPDWAAQMTMGLPRIQGSNAANIGPYVKAMAAADATAYNAWKALEHAGGEVFVVGGAVRDAAMGREPKDIDLMVRNLPAARVEKALSMLPGRMDFTGKDFGVFRYRDDHGEVEIALPRTEKSTGIGHGDFDVQADHTLSVEDDLHRRDFTVNAMAVDLRSGRLVDPFGGADDIRSGSLRTVHPNALGEDPLRVVRALVAHARHSLEPDETTRAQLQTHAPSVAHLPAERIQAELDKLMASKDPTAAIRLAQETGALKHILPEVHDAFGYDQRNPHHSFDLGTHLLGVLDGVVQQTPDPDLRMAGLLHDIGKPASRWTRCIDCDRPQSNDAEACDHCWGQNLSGHFYQHVDEDGRTWGANHEDVGATMAESRLRALKYPAARINRVRDLISHHMYADFSSPKGARKFLNRVGDHAEDLMVLRRADRGGKGTDEYQSIKTPVEMQEQLVAEARAAKAPTDRSALAINGADLIAAGFKPGREMGQILQRLTDAVVENPDLNDPQTLINLARGMAG